jgi:hypothetical protein
MNIIERRIANEKTFDILAEPYYQKGKLLRVPIGRAPEDV